MYSDGTCTICLLLCQDGLTWNVKWLDLAPSSHLFRHTAIQLLVKLAGASQELPDSMHIFGVKVDDKLKPAGYGGFADVFRGMYRDQPVALKRFTRLSLSSDSAQSEMLKVFVHKDVLRSAITECKPTEVHS